jgi:hypothetical protein
MGKKGLFKYSKQGFPPKVLMICEEEGGLAL